MNCDPNALMEAAKCFRCIPAGEQTAIQIYLLCQWANHLAPPGPPFAWVPDTELMRWTDSGGVHNGNLATFNATADIATVSVIDTALSIAITEINNASSLPNLQFLFCSDNDIDNLDVSGCDQLGRIDCFSNAMSTLTLTGCVALVTLNCQENDLTALDLSDCLLLQNLNCGTNNIDALNLSGHAALVLLDCSNNGMSTLNLTGCVALQIIQTTNNPGIVVTGP